MAATGRGGRRQKTIIFVFLIVIAALGYENWRLFTENVDTSPIPVQANLNFKTANSTPEGDDLLAPPKPRPRSAFSQTITRPLFSSNRRPIVKAPKVAEAKVQITAKDSAADKFQLIGVYQDGVEKGRALIRANPAAAGTWTSVGEDIEGWRLQEVRNDGAIIESGGRRRELRLYPDIETKASQ